MAADEFTTYSLKFFNVMLQGMASQPAAQPLNLSLGMLMSCAAGLFSRVVLGAHVIVAAPMAVALALTAMQLTGTIHRECLSLHSPPVLITDAA